MATLILVLLMAVAATVVWGNLLLVRGSRPVDGKGGLRRRVLRRIASVGDEIVVELELVPPIQLARIPARDLILVLDHSGSMGSGPASPLGECLRAARTFLEQCPEHLQVGLVVFNHRAERRCSIGSADQAVAGLGGVHGSGGTALDQALLAARDELLQNGRPGVPKSVLLFTDGYSDRQAARESAQILRKSVPEVEIFAAALGSGVDRDLLLEIVASESSFFSADSPDDYSGLFAGLARQMAGEAALALVAEEWLAAPFGLQSVCPSTADISPASAGSPSPALLRWTRPILDGRPLRLSYRLSARHPGWHPVASRLEVSWSMPDSTVQKAELGTGPKVLVLPPAMVWAWAVFHPLLAVWLWPRKYPLSAGPPEGKPGVPVRPQTLPTALPVLPNRPEGPSLTPALIIGLGDLGGEVLCRLRHRLSDRGIEEGPIEILHVGLERGGRPAMFGGFGLRPTESLRFEKDFFAYLDSLRQGPTPARSWIPWQEWLASTRPTTSQGERDRRRARLALLLAAKDFEDFLEAPIRQAIEREAAVLVVAAADEPEASGLVGDVLHFSASLGARNSLLLAPPRENERERAALGRELHRFLTLRGDDITSDRAVPPASAKRLVDRLVVLDEAGPNAAGVTAEMLYAYLASDAVRLELEPVNAGGGEVEVWKARLSTLVWPDGHLWCYVRDRALLRDIVLGACRWKIDDKRSEVIDSAQVGAWVAKFWSAEGARCRASLLVAKGADIRGGLSIEAALLGAIPHESPIHEQVAFHRAERCDFWAYLVDWSQGILDAEKSRGLVGWPLLKASLGAIEADYHRLIDQATSLHQRSNFESLSQLAQDLFVDHFLTLSRLQRLVAEQWLRWSDSGGSIASRLLEDVKSQEAALAASVDLEGIRHQAEAWADEFGSKLISQLGFEVAIDLARGTVSAITRIAERQMEADDDLLDALRQTLDLSRASIDPVVWLGDGMSPSAAPDPKTSRRLGGRAVRVFPEVDRSLELPDALYAGALELRRERLDRALGYVGVKDHDLPYVWPEEANAQRLANWLRQKPIEIETTTWSPPLIQLLREPNRLRNFFGYLALGQIKWDGHCWSLCSQRLLEGSPEPDPGAALEGLEVLARRIVTIRRSLDGEPLALPGATWQPSSTKAHEEVERHPLVRRAAEAPAFLMWRQVIQGLIAERISRVGPTDE